MSVVTNIILSFSIMENEISDIEDSYTNMVLINNWLRKHDHGAFGEDATIASGGEKHLETPVYLAAFNFFDLDEFLAFLRTLPWEEPENVQVFVQGQEEEKFTVYTII